MSTAPVAPSANTSPSAAAAGDSGTLTAAINTAVGSSETVPTAPTAPAAPAQPTAPTAPAAPAQPTASSAPPEAPTAEQLATITAERDAANTTLAAVLKAAGISTDAPEDPAAAITRSNAERDDALRQVAVTRLVPAGRSAAALLDSVSFMRSIASVKPGDDAAISAAITKHLAANPQVGVLPGAGSADAAANGTATAYRSVDDILRGK